MYIIECKKCGSRFTVPDVSKFLESSRNCASCGEIIPYSIKEAIKYLEGFSNSGNWRLYQVSTETKDLLPLAFLTKSEQ